MQLPQRERVSRICSPAGVTPAGPARAAQDGMMRPAVCGGGDGRVWVIGIAAGDLARARAAGFAPLDELPG